LNWVAPENIVGRTIDGEVEFPKLPPLEEYLQAFTEGNDEIDRNQRWNEAWTTAIQDPDRRSRREVENSPQQQQQQQQQQQRSKE
jgi:hypothetical protein